MVVVHCQSDVCNCNQRRFSAGHKGNFKRHKRVIHCQSAIYCSNQCGYLTRHESDLRRHGRLVHYQDKDYNRSREEKMVPRNPKTSNAKKYCD